MGRALYEFCPLSNFIAKLLYNCFSMPYQFWEMKFLFFYRFVICCFDHRFISGNDFKGII